MVVEELDLDGLLYRHRLDLNDLLNDLFNLNDLGHDFLDLNDLLNDLLDLDFLDLNLSLHHDPFNRNFLDLGLGHDRLDRDFLHDDPIDRHFLGDDLYLTAGGEHGGAPQSQACRGARAQHPPSSDCTNHGFLPRATACARHTPRPHVVTSRAHVVASCAGEKC